MTKRAEVISSVTDLGSMPVGQGIIRWMQNLPDTSTPPIQFYTQTSHDGTSWPDPWTGPYTNYTGSEILSENRRFIKFKAVLTTEDAGYSPELHKVEIEYPIASPNPPTVYSSTHPRDSWSATTNAYFSWSGADSNGVTVAAYYYKFNGSNTYMLPESVSSINILDCVEGKNTFRIAAQADWRNNSITSAYTEYSFFVDITKPGVPSVIEASHPENTPVDSNRVYFKVTAGDSTANTTVVSGIQGYSYTLNRHKTAPDSIIQSTDGEINLSDIDNGIWYFGVKAIDNAGNAGDILYYTLNIEYKGRILDDKKVKMYPTISREEFNAGYELIGSAERVLIEIKDGSGRLKEEREAAKGAGINTEKFNVSKYANGVYFVKITADRKDGKQDVVVKKVIVKK
ncbi:MAG TPA: T9SS type A sorting domain-containing protein [bacterium]|nr:T9SS type A sorting domain-containing protein [bacterium]